MNALEAIVLGLVQGLTEFLPISSSGHLRIVPAFFGWDDPGAAFTAVIQLGTMAAVLLYFRADLWRIAVAWLRSLRDPAVRGDLDARMGWYIILGTIPIAVLGLVFKDPIENQFRTLELIGATLIVFGFVMLAAEARSRRDRSLREITSRDGLLIGLAQALALVPGVRRSGAPISAGLLLNFDRAAAARYSFLLSVPAVVLSGLVELRHPGEGNLPIPPTALATLFAFVTGYLSIALLLRYLARHSIVVFVLYRLAVGGIVSSPPARGERRDWLAALTGGRPGETVACMTATPVRILVVANRTAAAERLLTAVEHRATSGPCTFALLVPDVEHGRDADWTLDTGQRLLSKA